jgi:hypothetical protein
MIAEIIHKIAQETRPKESVYHPRPSSCSPMFEGNPGRCIRQMVYHRMGAPAKPMPGRQILVFDDGNMHEDATAKWIFKSGLLLTDIQMGVDIPLPEGIVIPSLPWTCTRCQPHRLIGPDKLHGHIDGLLRILEAVRLYEHKALGSRAFAEILKGELPIDYLAQGAMYLSGLQVTRPEIRECILLARCKDTAAYAEIRFSYDRATDTVVVLEMIASNGASSSTQHEISGILASAFDKFAAVEAYGAAGVLPTRPYRQDTWRCSYCHYSGLCWEGYAEEVAAREPQTELPEMADPLTAYYTAQATKLQAEKDLKRLRPLVLGALEEANTTIGVAGAHQAAVRTQTKQVIDPNLLAPDVRAAATVPKTTEVLKVSKRQEATQETEEPEELEATPV